MNVKHLILLPGLFLFAVSCRQQEESPSEKTLPNIIFILADDLGYGDLSITGQQHFATPNIDQLAKEGMFFTQHYSGATVCAPSRSALMTGLHTGHTPIRGNKAIRPEGQWPMPAETFTLAALLKQKGYTTGAFGKWGLGYPGSEGDPMKQDFDTFYGYNCQRLGHNYYPYHLWDNTNKVMLKENEGFKKGQYAPQLIHERAISFIEEHKEGPFFLYYPSIIPHAELTAPAAYMEKYLGKFLPEKAFKGRDDGEEYRNGDYESQPNSHAAFAAMINVLDDQVGEIMAKVRELGLEENTLIIFTSDNGPHLEGGADPDYFNSNGIYRGYKRDLYEGGIHVPMIARWPGTIAEGSTSDHISAFWDVLPTIAELTKSNIETPVDGISFAPTLFGKGQQKKHSHLYWEFHELEGRQAIRKDHWKLIRYDVNNGGSYELYDLKEDASETHDLAMEMPEMVKELSTILEGSRTMSEVFQFKQHASNAEE